MGMAWERSWGQRRRQDETRQDKRRQDRAEMYRKSACLQKGTYTGIAV